jgi:hypothetical protein
MSGYADFNVPVFKEAKTILEQQGLSIQLPYDIESTVQEGWEWEDYLGEDIKLIGRCKGIIVLPEWQRSRGAKLEIAAGLMKSLKEPDFRFAELVRGNYLNWLESFEIANWWHDVWDEYSKVPYNKGE